MNSEENKNINNGNELQSQVLEEDNNSNVNNNDKQFVNEEIINNVYNTSEFQQHLLSEQNGLMSKTKKTNFISKKFVSIIIMLFIIVILVYEFINYFVIPMYLFNNYVQKYIKNNYNDYISYRYLNTNKCQTRDGVWSYKRTIENCYVSKYEIKTKTSEFLIYVTNRDSNVHVILGNSEMCANKINKYEKIDYSIIDYSILDEIIHYSTDCVKRLK